MDLDLLIVLTQNPNVEVYRKIFNLIDTLEFNLVGFTTFSNDSQFRYFEGYTVFPFDYIQKIKFDYALVDCTDESLSVLISPEERSGNLKTVYWILQQAMIRKYEDCDDTAIQETLQYWKTHELSVWNQYIDDRYPHVSYELIMDKSCGLPYINFKTIEDKERRMYFPRSRYDNQAKNNSPAVLWDILREQVPTSPHLYITDNHRVEEGDILIDAGVCEGNFVLRYADICSKIYLFEMESAWFEPLYRTFEYCWDKVTMIPKAVSDVCKAGSVTIDEAIPLSQNQKYFLKMDIEGAEPNALHGAKNLLQNNKVKASICSYHNTDDKLKIKSILQKCGYKTWTSDGYMVFIYDSKIWETADFRKGIVYAENF